MSSPIFDVDDRSNDNLAFQNFGSTTISADVPSGRISPSASPNMRASAGLYDAEQRFQSGLNGATKSGGVLNLDFYTGYFDVDTLTVLTRCWKTLLPRENYVEEVLAGVPDLYGPFWVPTTLIFSLFLTSSLSTSITAYLDGDSYTYDFTRLGAAVSLVYAYSLGLPLVIWAALKYWAGSTERSPVDIVSLYGYSTTVWIITSWLTLLPFAPLRLFLSFAATGLSLFFLTRNLYPVITTAPNVSARLLIVGVAALHLIMGMALWWGFLAGGKGALHTPTLGSGDGAGAGAGTGGEMDDPAGDALRRWLF
ncbi:hypothetical protein BCR35DRAFT_305647 [Leucosporidium creatinivorum]|uniref:Protein YIP n=1 Tax=Leucosporidium creatinivorum TaxID=106004 RepID=A0A1Y2F1Q6_9BASI|nr:hypothetical protein BCR35DRAFT_305647 [Leucosporidium creatinivorum]